MWGLRRGSVIWNSQNIHPHLSLEQKIISIAALHRFEAIFQYTEPSNTDFWCQIQDTGIPKSRCPSTFWEKTVRAFSYNLQNSISVIWIWFLRFKKFRRRTFRWYKIDKSTEPLRSPAWLFRFNIYRKQGDFVKFSLVVDSVLLMIAGGSVIWNLQNTKRHLSLCEKIISIAGLHRFKTKFQFTDPLC